MELAAEQSLGVRGDISIRVIEAATGRTVRTIQIRNLIVSNGLSVLGSLLVGYADPASSPRFTEIRLGTGTTPPVAGDLGLEAEPSPEVLCPVVATTSGNVGNKIEVSCQALVETTQANGLTLSEAGLYLRDPLTSSENLFARQVFPGITKTSALTIALDWRITFTA